MCASELANLRLKSQKGGSRTYRARSATGSRRVRTGVRALSRLILSRQLDQPFLFLCGVFKVRELVRHFSWAQGSVVGKVSTFGTSRSAPSSVGKMMISALLPALLLHATALLAPADKVDEYATYARDMRLATLQQKGVTTPCTCTPGYHVAHDVSCRVDSQGHIRVSHPHMVCVHEKFRSADGKCRLRAWTGTSDFHVCKRLSHSSCACCDCIGGKPHACAPGKYRGGSGQCMECAAGQFSSAETADQCMACVPGKFGAQTNQAACTDCGTGHYSADAGMVRCTACAAGTFADAGGMAACDNCRAGRFQASVGQTQCMDCLAGTFSRGAADRCDACAAGRWQPAAGSQQCRSAAQCEGSEFEKHAPSGTSDRICSSTEQCSASKYESGAAAGGQPRECSQCPSGNMCDGVSATPCPVGHFSEGLAGEDHTQCEACSPGRFAPVAGHPSCFECPAGYYQHMPGSHGCNGCPPGRFGAHTGMLHCRDCPSGQFAARSQSMQCEACPAGRGTAAPGQRECAIQL